MAEASTSGGLFSSREQLLRVLAVTVLLPTLIVAVDQTTYRLVRRGGTSTGEILFFFGLLVTQVGLVSVGVGRLVEHPILRWATYLWCLALTDILLVAMVGPYSSGAVALGYALGSGQVGLICFWVIFGRAHWAWRWPAVLLLSVLLVPLLLSHGSSAWFLVFCFQLIGVFAGLVALRARGFWLTDDYDASAMGDTTDARLQFSLRDLLVWSTAAAVVFALAGAMELRGLRYLRAADVLQGLSIAACLSIVAVAAIWAALGRGKTAIRFAILLALATAVSGLIYWAYVVRTDAIIARTRGFNLNELRWDMYWIGLWWFVWTPLAGLFLAELLLFFRVRGYRLARQVRES